MERRQVPLKLPLPLVVRVTVPEGAAGLAEVLVTVTVHGDADPANTGVAQVMLVLVRLTTSTEMLIECVSVPLFPVRETE